MTQDRSWPVPVDALGPVAAGVVLWRIRDQLHLTVIVKATFGLADDAMMSVAEPVEIYRAEVHHQGNPTRSIRAAGVEGSRQGGGTNFPMTSALPIPVLGTAVPSAG